jgi:hypothetical protein
MGHQNIHNVFNVEIQKIDEIFYHKFTNYSWRQSGLGKWHCTFLVGPPNHACPIYIYIYYIEDAFDVFHQTTLIV